MQSSQIDPVRTGAPEAFTEERIAGHGLATQLAVDSLRALILDGVFRPGERLSEKTINARLQVSRTPLREALKVLSSEGLVTLEPNRGATITQLSLADLQSTFELLGALEGAAAELACLRASNAEIEEIGQMHDTMLAKYQARSLSDYFRLNKAIHLAIVEAAHNAAITRVYSLEAARVDRFRYTSNRDPVTWARSIRQHEQILDALRQREAALLRECLVSHRRSGWELARQQYEVESSLST